MRLFVAAGAVTAALLLSGCSTVNGMFDDPEQDEVVQPVAQQATAAPVVASGPNPFCLNIASQDANRGYTPDIARAIAVRSYASCVAMFGNQVR